MVNTYKFLIDADELFEKIGSDKKDDLMAELSLYKSFIEMCLYGKDDISVSFENRSDRDTCAKDWGHRFRPGVVRII